MDGDRNGQWRAFGNGGFRYLGNDGVPVSSGIEEVVVRDLLAVAVPMMRSTRSGVGQNDAESGRSLVAVAEREIKVEQESKGSTVPASVWNDRW
ncbi:hypothetical protein E2562_029371 [Oryza meyeriana var. granulata]|uniref:DUF834 domain-containing protein n=1 Tax=Oryza meyeriana var. granulata TaxID=110450 RepID=A0A6G1C9V2_9ORYZ|nr:hypothetical protein E2562_029371 [Oryza meyeriana var. granulata]